MEKRCYVFPHFMLSPIAKGIQGTHAVVNMFNRYVPNPGNNEEVSVNDNPEKDAYSILWDWSLNYKTEIMLNPGVSENLDDLFYLLQDPENFYPWAKFDEDEYSLKGIMTAISIVLPEKIFKTASFYKTRNFFWQENIGRLVCSDITKITVEDIELLESYGRFNSFEMSLVQALGNYRLAS